MKLDLNGLLDKPIHVSGLGLILLPLGLLIPDDGGSTHL
jgi:hypothetical protein